MKQRCRQGFFTKKSVALVVGAFLSIGLLAGCGSDSKTADANKTYRVGVIQLLEHPALDAANQGFVDGLRSQGFEEGKNLILDQQNAQADQSNLSTIAQRFVANKEDLIGAIATPSAQTIANQTKTIPVVGMAITDYVAAKLANTNEKPGKNITGVSDMLPPEKSLELIRTLLPQAKVIGVIYNASEVNSQVQVDAFKKLAEAQGIEVKESIASNLNEVQQAVTDIAHKGVDAVYLPTDNVVASAFPVIFKALHDANIPAFPSDSAAAKFGGLAMYSVDYYGSGFKAGQMAAEILRGKATPSDMPIEFPKDLTLIVNEKDVEHFHITIPESLKKEAKFVQ